MTLAAALLACWLAVLSWPRRGPRPPLVTDVTPRARRDRWRERWRVASAMVPVPGRARAVRHRRELALLGVLDAFAAGLGVGLTTDDALREATGTTDDPVVREILRADEEEDADWIRDLRPGLMGSAGRPRAGAELDGLTLLARARRLSQRLGTPLAESVRAVAVLLRAEIAARRAVTVAMSEARATVVVLVALPLLGPALAVGVGVSPRDLYGSPAGAGCAFLGAGLVGLGIWWMRRLLRRVARSGEMP